MYYSDQYKTKNIMPKIDLKQLYLQLELEINRLSSSNLMIYREDLREDAHEVIRLLKMYSGFWLVLL
jgi:hypothetical protein